MSGPTTSSMRQEIEANFDLLCDALEEGCGCDELGSGRCIMLGASKEDKGQP